MLAWAVLLSVVAGFVDAVCYLSLGRAFAANMTGNLVELGIAAADGHWRQSLWLGSIIVAFLAGVLIARLILRAHRSPRLSLVIEGAMIAAAGTGLLGGAATPLLAAALALQNEIGLHGMVAVNIAFITGDIQQLGERLVGETLPAARKGGDKQPRVILAILLCYAAGAAIGSVGAHFGAASLFAPAAILLAAAALPARSTGLAARERPDG